MSSQHALQAPALRGDVDAPALRPVEVVVDRAQRRARPKIAYALVATAALFVLLLAQLAISIALSDGAYRISALQTEQTELARDQQKYAEQLDVLSSPQNLAVNAEALGMVRNSNPVYLDAATGTVHGDPAPAEAPAEGAAGNIIGNTLLDGVPVAAAASAEAAGGAQPTAGPATTAPAGVGTPAATDAASTVPGTPGAVAPQAGQQSVASAADQLVAPQTR